MMKKLLYNIGVAMAMWILASCSQEVKIAVRSEEPSPLMEEYADLIIPSNIAPINFFVEAEDGLEGLVLREKCRYASCPKPLLQ